MGDWLAGVRAGAALRAGGREFCLGINLCNCASHVFEGMRVLMFEHMFRADLMWQAAALNPLGFYSPPLAA